LPHGCAEQKKKEKAKLSISIEWSSAQPAAFGDSLKISAEVPPQRTVVGDDDDDDQDGDDDEVKAASYQASNA
jgi:hypothetical protein